MENPANLILVIFGASGDLASRKLIPALFSLMVQRLLPEKFAILGVGRTSFSDDDFRKKMKESIISFSEEKEPELKKIDQFNIIKHARKYMF
jgi:glucose-6-phosphate 1-dehydrogenase